MAYLDQMRDTATLQQSVETDDSYGGTEVWTNRVSFPCIARQMSAAKLGTYGRTGVELGISFDVDDRITRTQGKLSLYELLIEPDQDAYRILFQGTRTMTIVGTTKLSQNIHNTMSMVLRLDTIEAPERVGRMDAP